MKKKIIVLMLAGMMALSTTACGGSNNTSSNNDKSASTKEESVVANNSTSNDTSKDTTEDSVDDDGFEKVDSINVDTNEVSLKYTGSEVVDGTDNDGNAIKEAVVYFDYTNKTSTPADITSAFMIDAYQGGVGLINFVTSIDGNDAVENYYTEIKDGATINVGFVFQLENTDDDLEIQIQSGMSELYENAQDFFYQKQLITLN